MASRPFLLAMLVCSLLLSDNGVEGGRKLTREEDLELEKQLKLLNKPAVKIIKTKYGDVYGCVDFYKQPAFDHPLLRNRTFYFQVCLFFCYRIRNQDSTMANVPQNIWLNGKGCPVGTVPIKRVTKDDLIRAKLHSERYVLNDDKPGITRAIARTKADPNKKFYGGQMRASLYNPSVANNQYSSSQMKIRNGPDSIQVGWTVSQLAGDHCLCSFLYYAFYFVYKQNAKTQCFNELCIGFLLVNPGIPLDTVFEPTSTRGGPIYDWKFTVYQDHQGNWALQFGSNDTLVGFWPVELFTGLANPASSVEWGGELYSPPGQPGPQMGSGFVPIEDTRYDAFCRQISTFNENRQAVDAVDTESFAEGTGNYVVKDEGNVGDGKSTHALPVCEILQAYWTLNRVSNASLNWEGGPSEAANSTTNASDFKHSTSSPCSSCYPVSICSVLYGLEALRTDLTTILMSLLLDSSMLLTESIS
ncbi:hypothetical protein L1049_012602 [Liquidambar formosana]|uniref:Neprosin PEP catalytic domain-containing protein n=1 Tax=Liquidambar formosana TaxID=63359 RepID=A0AAP0R459_LIQFO